MPDGKPVLGDEGQALRTAECLEILGKSFALDQQGRQDEAMELLDHADPTTLTLIGGGMIIGQIPTPDSDDWGEFLAAAWDKVSK